MVCLCCDLRERGVNSNAKGRRRWAGSFKLLPIGTILLPLMLSNNDAACDCKAFGNADDTSGSN